MADVLAGDEPLKQLFAGLTEYTFQVDLGVADPPLIDYLSDLLVRFVRVDTIFGIRNSHGERLQQVADMLVEAGHRTDRPQRELHRHIGDFTLFYVGVFPEAVDHLKKRNAKDALLDYCEQGKRAYHKASELTDNEHRTEAGLFQRLSDEFELCSVGLAKVRQEWQRK
ncbi:hypothetical protein Pan44_09830 [Caulifigura coniformis]|uniref:Uncharacterized protein n=1 Tax=Caulifigura coniformis TaxID=2527983 RepID=A0A517SA14_9PLAN|nr:hypothetical protein [Caulifigura coniformis]QDT52969.1 hypothetical protein Pan44_09830 [Caulifigura coniformis]